MAESRDPVPGVGHLCACQLHRHRPADQGRRRLRQGRRRAEDAPLFQGARLRRRDRRRALALPRSRAASCSSTSSPTCRRSPRTSPTNGSSTRPEAELFGAQGQARPADPVHLVEDLRPGPSPLRRRRRRAHDPQVPRRDRLEAAAQPHGALLGSAADGAAQLPLRLSERAPRRPALADGRAARAAARPG